MEGESVVWVSGGEQFYEEDLFVLLGGLFGGSVG